MSHVVAQAIRFFLGSSLLAAMLAADGAIALAQTPTLAPARLAVDSVLIKGGPRLYGLIIGKNEDGSVAIAVERAWLEKTYRKFHRDETALENDVARAVREKTLERLGAWTAGRAADKNLLLFLEEERKRLAATDGERPSPAQFVVIQVPAEKVGNMFRQPAERRQIGMLAFRERLKDVTTRSASSLGKELDGLSIDRRQQADLSDRVPPMLEGERSWAARVALVEYRLRKQLNFQGAGRLLERTGDGAAPVDFDKLLQAVFEEQTADQLAELKALLGTDLGGPAKPPRDTAKPARDTAGKADWIMKAVRLAEQDGVTGFRVARLTKEAAGRREGNRAFTEFLPMIAVEMQFFAKMPGGEWILIWGESFQADATKVSAEAREEVAAAPEVKRITELLSKAGLGDEGRLEKAIAFGAATKTALDEAHVTFGKMLLASTRQLDGPPIPLPESP